MVLQVSRRLSCLHLCDDTIVAFDRGGRGHGHGKIRHPSRSLFPIRSSLSVGQNALGSGMAEIKETGEGPEGRRRPRGRAESIISEKAIKKRQRSIERELLATFCCRRPGTSRDFLLPLAVPAPPPSPSSPPRPAAVDGRRPPPSADLLYDVINRFASWNGRKRRPKMPKKLDVGKNDAENGVWPLPRKS